MRSTHQNKQRPSRRKGGGSSEGFATVEKNIVEGVR